LKSKAKNRNLCSRFPGSAFLAAGMLASSAQAALLVEYNFGEGSGTAVANTGTLGAAANGTLTGSWSTSTPSGTGHSVSFTGSNAAEGVSTGSAVAGLNGLNQVTGVLWLNLRAAPAKYDRLVSNSSSGNGFDFAVSGVSGGNFTVLLNLDSVVGTASDSISQNLNNWTFLAFTYDGTVTTENLKFYTATIANSVAQLGGTKTANAGALGTSTNPFEVANTALTGEDRTPPALFDNVRIYDTVLSSAELEAIRVATVPEPAALALLGLGSVALLRRRRAA